MDNGLKEYILAVVCQDMGKVNPGGCPVFFAANNEEQERTSLLLARIMGGIVHDLENGLYIIVKH